MTEPLSTKYNPAEFEGPLYQEWEERGYFRADPNRVFNGENVSQMHTVAPHVGTAVQAIEEVIKAGTDGALAKFARTFARLKHNQAAVNDPGDDDRAFY